MENALSQIFPDGETVRSRLGVDLASLASIDTCLVLPWPFSPLVACGKWKHLALLAAARWPRTRSAYPAVRDWRRFAIAGGENPPVEHDAAAEANLLQAGMFLELADYLRSKRLGIEAACSNSFDAEDERTKIEMYAGWLERCHHAVTPEAAKEQIVKKSQGRGGSYFSEYGCFGSYLSDFFIRVLCFSFDLRATSQNLPESYVARAFKKAVRLLPPAVRQCVEEMFRNQVFPSKSTMSRASLLLDVAFMRVMARRHKGLIENKAVFFFLSDASPQNTRLLQITEYICIGGFGERELEEVAKHILLLCTCYLCFCQRQGCIFVSLGIMVLLLSLLIVFIFMSSYNHNLLMYRFTLVSLSLSLSLICTEFDLFIFRDSFHLFL